MMGLVAIAGASGITAIAAGAVLIATVFAAVHHAEVVAHRIGEPFGTLVLAVAVTVIEVALIVSIMLGFAADKAGLARDTVFAAVMPSTPFTFCSIGRATSRATVAALAPG